MHPAPRGAGEARVIGRRVGPYEIVAEVGRGGMGRVYEAVDLRLGRRVAVKAMSPEVAENEEARRRFRLEIEAVSRLAHPFICQVFDLLEVDGQELMVSELVNGVSLADRLAQGPLPLEEAVRLGAELAEALGEAHRRGVVHRDIKPSNVLVTPSRHAKVLDFGVSRLLGGGVGELPASDEAAWKPGTPTLHLPRTAAGRVFGTPGYMAPEQALGEPSDARADIFSLGVLLFEMIAGRSPWPRGSLSEYHRRLFSGDVPSLGDVVPGLPPELVELVDRMLRVEVADRPQTMAAVEERLLALIAAFGGTPPRGLPGADLPSGGAASGAAAETLRFGGAASRRRRIVVAVAVLALAGLVGATVWTAVTRARRTSAAMERLPEVARLAAAGSWAEAYALAVELEATLGPREEIAGLLPEISDLLTVRSDPPGAAVTLERYVPGGPPGRPERVGTTPIEGLRVGRGDYLLRVESAGHLPLLRTVSSALNRNEAPLGVAPAIEIEVILRPAIDAPEGMVPVPGGRYRLASWSPGRWSELELADFFVDVYEVSNERYRDFVRGGGYHDRQAWGSAAAAAGVDLAAVLPTLVDRTRLPGPRRWINQEFPEGEGRLPVSGVTWLEAATFCASRGHLLPSAHQWEKTSRNAELTHFAGMVMPWGLETYGGGASGRANFLGTGPAPVGSHPFGVSPWGVHDLAGNVAEWLLDPLGEGFAVAGGSWADPPYSFGRAAWRPPLAASETIGFRCVTAPPPGAGEQRVARLETSEVWQLPEPVAGSRFAALLEHYAYDSKPGDAEVLEVAESPSWRRETIRFPGAADDPVLAYLWLPTSARPPFQAINYVVSSTAFVGRTTAEEVEDLLEPQLRAGRAVFAVVPRGGLERPWAGWTGAPGHGDPATVAFRNEMVLFVTEYRLGLDYLESRPEIDAGRIAHLGFSWGASAAGVILAAVEPRLRSVVFLGGGLHRIHLRALPAANPAVFAPHVRQPKLLLNGRWDEIFHADGELRVLWDLLPEPKRLELVDAGHLPAVEIRAPIVNAWLDETLGPPAR